jgi:diguanylate cyclase (GGDEF)-like protein
MNLFPVSETSQSASPLAFEGHGGIQAQQRKAEFRSLARREWWLWFSLISVSVLAAATLILSSFRTFFLHDDHFYEIGSAQARWAVLCLLLLFNGWFALRQYSFRRWRGQLERRETLSEEFARPLETTASQESAGNACSRTALELQLGKEIARARRQNVSLTLITFHLDDFAELAGKLGNTAAEELAAEFARRLKEASRGSDFAARIASDDFLLVLPKCSLKEARVVLDRLGSVETRAAGKKVALAYTSGWVDYQAGELPSDLLRKATDILHLYKSVASDTTAALA